MDITLRPGLRRGNIIPPPSKSDAHRALICAALANKPTRINISGALNDDINATISCLMALGAAVSSLSGGLLISPSEKRVNNPVLDCAESGSTLRFLLPCAPILADGASFIGSGRLPMRPLSPLLAAMSSLGVSASSARGDTAADGIPLTLSGTLKSGVCELPGDVSSQFISGLLMALSATDGTSEIRLTTPLQSAAYAEMTINTLRRFGADISVSAHGYHIRGGKLKAPGEYKIEADWSGAAFFIAMRALGCDITVSGLSDNSAQPDRAIAALCGGSKNSGDAILGAAPLPDEIDVSEFPDLFPILSVLAAGKTGKTRLMNASRLRIKESDRIAAAASLIRSLGGACAEGADFLEISGAGRLRGGTVSSAGDHRIAMSAAAAAVICGEPVTITGADCVSKSYAGFWTEYKGLDLNSPL